jgi:hypothetical protein
MSGAGIQDATQIVVPFDGSLNARVREACTARRRSADHPPSGWSAATVAEHLADLATQLLDRDHQIPDGSFAARVRLAALALTDDNDPQRTQTFRELVAAVTLLEQRAKGEAPIGESIVLALV